MSKMVPSPMISRAALMTIFAVGLLTAPLSLDAQNTTKSVRIGWLGLASPAPEVLRFVGAFKDGLRQSGFVEGQNVAFEYRWANGQSERLPALAAELIGLKVDIIVVPNTLGALAAKEATSTIPIVLLGADADALGLGARLGRPGGNLTGVTLTAGPEIGGKYLPIFFLHRQRLAGLAAKHRLPAIYGLTEHVEAGGLMAYSANFQDVARRGAIYVDRILRGAKPGDLPIEQPMRFELIINAKTAKTLGLTLAPSLLSRADRVIE